MVAYRGVLIIASGTTQGVGRSWDTWFEWYNTSDPAVTGMLTEPSWLSVSPDGTTRLYPAAVVADDVLIISHGYEYENVTNSSVTQQVIQEQGRVKSTTYESISPIIWNICGYCPTLLSTPMFTTTLFFPITLRRCRWLGHR